MAATQFGIVPWGDALVLAVLAILFGILAVVGVRSLSLRYSSLDPRPSREVGLGVCVGLLVLMLARLVVQSAMYGEIYYSAWIFDLAMVVLVVLVALALTVSPAVRNLYAGVQLFASATTVTAADIPNLGQPVRPSGVLSRLRIRGLRRRCCSRLRRVRRSCGRRLLRIRRRTTIL